LHHYLYIALFYELRDVAHCTLPGVRVDFTTLRIFLSFTTVQSDGLISIINTVRS
jgi:hypothetical protein